MPVTENLPEAWYVSPNAHLCTIKDFADLCRVVNARVERAVAFNASGQQLGTWIPLTVHNLMGEKAVFMLTQARARLSSRYERLAGRHVRFEAPPGRGELRLPPRIGAGRQRAHQLLARLDDDDAGKAGPQPRADALEGGRPAHQPLPVDRRHVERAASIRAA